MTDKLDLTSLDLVNENVKKIAELFPNCVTENANGKTIDFDLLKQELNHEVIEGNKERYRLEWPGKREAIVTANLPITKTLRPVREDSVEFDNTQNLYIEGDNLDVLKLLQESYLSKIKMIYIDPPYNTGKDFVYKDNFTQDSEEHNIESGFKDEYNQKLISNPETSGRYHSDWLSMMYPRLKLSRNLLKEDGVIFISIDDNEVHNLRKLCDEIFGEVNFIADIIWEGNGKNDSKYISIAHENILFYAKNKSYLIENQITFRANKEGVNEIYEIVNKLISENKEDYSVASDELRNWYNQLNKNHPSWQHRHYNKIDHKGVYFPGDISAESGRGREPYDVIHPITGKKCKMPERGWPTKKTMEEWTSLDLIDFGENETFVPKRKRYLADTDNYVLPSVIYKDSRSAYKNMVSLMGGKVFDNPKDVGIIKKYIEICTNKNDIVVDFYSGSATTAEATMRLNSEDYGNRKFILVQLPEITNNDSEAYKDGFKNICEIGKERIRRAANQIKEETIANENDKKDKINFDEESNKSNNLDLGFRVFRLAESNMKDVYYRPQDFKQEQLDAFSDNIKPDRTADDLLIQIMLDWGLPLSLKIEQLTIDKKQVFKVAENSLLACFDNGLNEVFAKEIAKLKPLRVVFKDSSFADNSAKENVKQLLKQLSPETEMKVI
ncbi:MAG: site-specific DNA-methyltransferase [Bacteroidia bacterium]